MNKKNREKLIEKINILGPWSHGYFDMGDGLVIEDPDRIQKNRLIFYKDYFTDIISKFYKRKTLENKTLCEIGCNTGYFLYELYKKFKFKFAMGLEPRKSNLAKAKFIARHFKLPSKRYMLSQFDVLTNNKKLPVYDIVIALKHLYPLVVSGGIVLLDEYAMDGFPGESKAFDEYFKGKRPVMKKFPYISTPGGYFIKGH